MVQPADISPIPQAEAPRDCPLCPRLVAFRQECRAEHPDWWNAPVPAFGDRNAWLAIIGLAPGKHGANRTGRPFTGDFAGELLYATLSKFGLAEGDYGADPVEAWAAGSTLSPPRPPAIDSRARLFTPTGSVRIVTQFRSTSLAILTFFL